MLRPVAYRQQMKMHPLQHKQLLTRKRSSPIRLLGAIIIAMVLCCFSIADGADASTVTENSASCEPGWTLKGQSCYRLTSEDLTWNKAQENCRSMNSLLAEVENAGEQDALNDFLNSQEPSIFGAWIGLSDQRKENIWTWGSGRPLKFSKWSESEPNNKGGNEYCVNAWPATQSSWNDNDCSKTFQGVCQKASCANGWTSTRNSCYQLTDALTREAARIKCSSIDGSLVEINNLQEQEELHDFLRSQGTKAFIAWIGLSDPQKNRVWKWDSGSDLKYHKWIAGEPNNAGGQEYCVNVWQQNNFDWNDAPCNINYPGVCKQRKADTTTPEPPITGPIATTADALGCDITDTSCRTIRQCTLCTTRIFEQYLDLTWRSYCRTLIQRGSCTPRV